MTDRVTLTEIVDMTPEEVAVYDRFQSNLTRALLLTKGSAAPHLALGASFTLGLLPLLLREIVVLRVAKLRESDFERALHYPLAVQAGMTDAEIDAVENGRYAQMSAERAALVRYVSECTIDHRASAGAFWALREYYSQNAIAEVTHLAGHAMMTAMYLASLDIPLDEKFASWGRLAELRQS